MHMTSRNKGFTLVELLVAMLISSLLISVTVAVYSAFRKTLAADQSAADLSQNGRVALDRISRELRQTPEIVTVLPTDQSDVSVTQPGEVEFQDGHADDLTYKRYYINGSYLELDTEEYYFASDTSTRVAWNSVGTSGDSPVKHVISTQIVAETVSSLALYGGKPLEVIISTTDGKQTVTLRTNVNERNL